jgi:hypothetical protein
MKYPRPFQVRKVVQVAHAYARRLAGRTRLKHQVRRRAVHQRPIQLEFLRVGHAEHMLLQRGDGAARCEDDDALRTALVDQLG